MTPHTCPQSINFFNILFLQVVFLYLIIILSFGLTTIGKFTSAIQVNLIHCFLKITCQNFSNFIFDRQHFHVRDKLFEVFKCLPSMLACDFIKLKKNQQHFSINSLQPPPPIPSYFRAFERKSPQDFLNYDNPCNVSAYRAF